MVYESVGPNTSVSPQAPIWFITGCSAGFGLALARQAISHALRTVINARDPTQLKDYAVTAHVLVLKRDVTDQAQATEAIQAAESRFGGIDVL